MRKQNHWQILPGHPDRYSAGGFLFCSASRRYP